MIYRIFDTTNMLLSSLAILGNFFCFIEFVFFMVPYSSQKQFAYEIFKIYKKLYNYFVTVLHVI